MENKSPNLLNAVSGLIITIALIWGSYYLISYFVDLLRSIDKQVAATIIAASGTALGAVGAALYVQKKTKEREIFEAHRVKKAEAYDKFMNTLIDVFKSSLKNSPEIPESNQDKYIEFFIDFNKDIIVWSSPSFIKSFETWRLGSQDPNQNALLLMDDVLREIRNDLGNSNKGINRGDLIKLFLKNPKELDEVTIGKLN